MLVCPFFIYFFYSNKCTKSSWRTATCSWNTPAGSPWSRSPRSRRRVEELRRKPRQSRTFLSLTCRFPRSSGWRRRGLVWRKKNKLSFSCCFFDTESNRAGERKCSTKTRNIPLLRKCNRTHQHTVFYYCHLIILDFKLFLEIILLLILFIFLSSCVVLQNICFGRRENPSKSFI